MNKKEPGKAIVTVRNSEIARFGTIHERQTPLKVYADRCGPRTSERLIEERIQSHVKQFTRKLKGDKNMKYRRRELGSGESSLRSNISRAMRGRIPKVPNFSALQIRRNTNQADSQNDLVLLHFSASLSALQQVAPAVLTTQSKRARIMVSATHHRTRQ